MENSYVYVGECKSVLKLRDELYCCVSLENFKEKVMCLRLTMLVRRKGRVNRNRNGCRSVSVSTCESAKVSISLTNNVTSRGRRGSEEIGGDEGEFPCLLL